jgi:chorismate mutase/prephenate dehydratase
VAHRVKRIGDDDEDGIGRVLRRLFDDRPVSLVVFETHHTAGALHHALGAFAETGVSLNRIESRPTLARRWEYRFIVGVDGHRSAEPLRGALTELRRRAHAVRVVGSFPSAG